eukprot:11739641-Karenia_brevis.AAC.1
MTGLDVNVAKATGFVENPARFYAAVGQATMLPKEAWVAAPTGEPGDATIEDLPAHVAETEPRGEVVYRRDDASGGSSGQRNGELAEEQSPSPLQSRSRSQHGSR